ncbi:rhamnogalacturonan endolyase family protein [Hymenobacter cellulosilyticus]|uniref:Rhamnogalacturonan I lyase beta-sheet domain-containing protein n=1 Tax=Hymenobacter cellulosilyticus TaxID=2932248 RepID=A0A8T9Q3R9_9BACT|nr:hypothetical protein [Hymenobacter cellulosilyticus]UOQ70440.1 hypothetical protein MUN79_17075 [Hymenobacter cellulosilyticus]
MLMAAGLSFVGAAPRGFNAYPPAAAPVQAERLGRGLVAVAQPDGRIFLSWRLLASDPATASFTLYRHLGNGQKVKLTSQPTTRTNWLDKVDVSSNAPAVAYSVELAGTKSGLVEQAAIWPQSFLRVPLRIPAGAP